jgi:hypothetical protein
MGSFVMFTLVMTLMVVSCRAEEDQVFTKLPTLRGPKPGSKLVGAHHRNARATPYSCATPTLLTPSQQTESVVVHNNWRGKEPAANMLQLTWSSMLANVAQGWANQCQWEHGYLIDCNGNNIGQNLYVSSNTASYPTLNVTSVITAWNNERNDWNFKTATCATGKICGHWTALVAARSLQVGCAYALCPTMNIAGITRTNNLLVVCDYSPPGNVAGDPIYLPGTTCLNCDSDNTGAGFKCVSNLCVPCTPSNDAACKCGKTQTCQNGGSWSTASCTCVCPKAFFGLNCERACSCADAMPDDCPDWIDMCSDPSYADFMGANCITTCKLPCKLPASCS